jgi:hypothetical protein
MCWSGVRAASTAITHWKCQHKNTYANSPGSYSVQNHCAWFHDKPNMIWQFNWFLKFPRSARHGQILFQDQRKIEPVHMIKPKDHAGRYCSTGSQTKVVVKSFPLHSIWHASYSNFWALNGTVNPDHIIDIYMQEYAKCHTGKTAVSHGIHRRYFSATRDRLRDSISPCRTRIQNSAAPHLT